MSAVRDEELGMKFFISDVESGPMDELPEPPCRAKDWDSAVQQADRMCRKGGLARVKVILDGQVYEATQPEWRPTGVVLVLDLAANDWHHVLLQEQLQSMIMADPSSDPQAFRWRLVTDKQTAATDATVREVLPQIEAQLYADWGRSMQVVEHQDPTGQLPPEYAGQAVA